MTRNGFLMVTMAPPPAMEEEFNDWYDTEHLPERIAIDGFLSATRYVCTSGFPRYMAAYDLASNKVLAEPPYQAVSGENFSPWSKRILNRVRGLWRVTGEQVYPGQAVEQHGPRLLLLGYRNVSDEMSALLIDALRTSYEGDERVIQLRVIRDDAHGANYVALIEGRDSLADISASARKGAFGRHLHVVNEYARYWAYSPDAALSKALA